MTGSAVGAGVGGNTGAATGGVVGMTGAAACTGQGSSSDGTV